MDIFTLKIEFLSIALAPLRLTNPRTKSPEWWRNVHAVTIPVVTETIQHSPAAKVEGAEEVSRRIRISEKSDSCSLLLLSSV